MSVSSKFQIPFLSKNFNNINIPTYGNFNSCNNTCPDDKTKIYNYEDNLCSINETSLYCADVQDDSFESNQNYSTFMMINGKCNDPKKCFFTSNTYLDEDENYRRLTEKDNPNKTLKNCCNTEDDFCYHNLMWGNSCNVALEKDKSDIKATKDRVFLPWNTWAGGNGFQNTSPCNSKNAFGQRCITHSGVIGCASGLDKKWCGPTINNGAIDWTIDGNKNGPYTICSDLYGRHAINNSYVLGDLDNGTQRYFGNIICGPYINPKDKSFKNRAVDVCDYKNRVNEGSLSLKFPYGCPGSNENITDNNLCVPTDSKTGQQKKDKPQTYYGLLHYDYPGSNIQYYPLKK